MHNWKKICVVFSTYNEKDSVRKFINDCFGLGNNESMNQWINESIVDYVIAVNNNATEWTKEEIEKTNAIQVFEKKQWYWYGYRRWIHEAIKKWSDIIILVEPDWTFLASDIKKFLAYSDDFRVVFWTRTTSACIWSWANMWFFLKWWNWAVAKMIEVLFNTTHLSDVWCTYKLFHRDILEKMESEFSVWASHFWPELMLLTIKYKVDFVEIPVHYVKRIWESSVTGDFWKTLKLWTRMILFMLHFRFFK